MDWIKRNYDQAALLLLGLVLLAMSGMLIMNAMSFQDTFKDIQGNVAQNNKVPPPDLSGLQRANEALEKPAMWQPGKDAGSLFVSEKYVISENRPQRIKELTIQGVPSAWFETYGLDVLDPNVLNEDPDGDGFTNHEEFEAKTDPTNKASHPPYYLKLRLVRFIQVPFRLILQAYDGDPAKPESLSFQINTVDVRQPTQFPKLNEMIANTKFKIVKFEHKVVTNPSTGTDQDVSEVTVQNVETGTQIVLPLEKIVNSPDSYALFRYLIDGKDYKVKKDATFSLPPDNIQLKLIDIKEGEAVIQTPQGEKVTVSKLQP